MAKIKKINFAEHSLYGMKSISLSTKQQSDNHYTLIIGQNGTGKSELLKNIVNFTNKEITRHTQHIVELYQESFSIEYHNDAPLKRYWHQH